MAAQIPTPDNLNRWLHQNPEQLVELLQIVQQLSKLEVIVNQPGKPTQRIPVQLTGTDNAQIRINLLS